MSWPTARLGDLYAKRLPSVDPSRFEDEEFDLFSVPAYTNRIPDHVFGSDIGSTKVEVRPGDVLICKIVPHIRRAWVVPPGSKSRQIASGEWIVLRGDQFDPNFVRHFLLSDSFHSQFMSTVAGVGGSLVRARPAFAADIDIPLPPLPEQRRIASILDQADALRAARYATLDALEASTTALFDEMVGRPSKNMSKYPTERIDQVAHTRLGKMLDAAKQTGESTKKYLRNANVQWMRFELDSLAEMDFSSADQLEFSLRDGDVLVCEGGQPGRSAVWRSQIEDVFFQKALHRVRVDHSVLLPEVFVRTMSDLVLSGALADSISSATIAHLTGEKLKAIEIPIPPITVQTEYLKQAIALDGLVSLSQAHLAKLDELFASLQHRAFRGEL